MTDRSFNRFIRRWYYSQIIHVIEIPLQILFAASTTLSEFTVVQRYYRLRCTNASYSINRRISNLWTTQYVSFFILNKFSVWRKKICEETERYVNLFKLTWGIIFTHFPSPFERAPSRNAANSFQSEVPGWSWRSKVTYFVSFSLLHLFCRLLSSPKQCENKVKMSQIS